MVYSEGDARAPITFCHMKTLLFWIPWSVLSFIILGTFYAKYKTAYVRALKIGAFGVNVLVLFLFFFPWIPESGATGLGLLRGGNYWAWIIFGLLCSASVLYCVPRTSLLKTGALMQCLGAVLMIVAMTQLVPGTVTLSFRFIAPIVASLLLLINSVIALVLWHQLQLKDKIL